MRRQGGHPPLCLRRFEQWQTSPHVAAPPTDPLVERVTVTSKVPLLGRELNLSKCFSLMFCAETGVQRRRRTQRCQSHTHTHTTVHPPPLLSSNFSPAGEKYSLLRFIECRKLRCTQRRCTFHTEDGHPRLMSLSAFGKKETEKQTASKSVTSPSRWLQQHGPGLILSRDLAPYPIPTPLPPARLHPLHLLSPSLQIIAGGVIGQVRLLFSSGCASIVWGEVDRNSREHPADCPAADSISPN